MIWPSQLNELTHQLCDTFGQSVVYTRKNTGEIFEIKAIFDIAYFVSEVGGKVGANIPEKTLDIRLSDIGGQSPKQGDEVLIDGTRYMVKDVKQSTSGMMKAVLREEE